MVFFFALVFLKTNEGTGSRNLPQENNYVLTLFFNNRLTDWIGIRKSQALSRMRSRLTEQNLNWLMLIAMEGPEVLSSAQKDSIIRRFNRKVRKVTVK